MTAYEAVYEQGTTVRVLRQETVAWGTGALTLERPAGFTFKPGQSVDLTLVDPPETDAKGDRRALSLVSAPFERELVVATRLRGSAFKRSLGTLAPGAKVRLDGPFGSFALHADRARTAVFIAGGIGITPFMSMLRQTLHGEPPRPLVLLYSNRQPRDAAFLAELELLEQRHRGTFQFVPTMSQRVTVQEWKGRQGLIDAELIAAVLAEQRHPVFYVVGPPRMVGGMRELLATFKVSDDDIRSEDFGGY
jgi:ferredoxin-NADP reductase